MREDDLDLARKVVRTPTNPFEAAAKDEVFVPKEIIARRIQEISAGIYKATSPAEAGTVEPRHQLEPAPVRPKTDR